jgi:eukaryotic-like serine/threonine-protein kinase
VTLAIVKRAACEPSSWLGGPHTMTCVAERESGRTVGGWLLHHHNGRHVAVLSATIAGVDPFKRTELAPIDTVSDAPVDDARPRIAGRYEVLGMLGAGAMGTVYRVRDLELDEIVALKILNRELAASPGMLERFRREAKLARRVTHRNVARTFDIGEDGGERFLTMEYVDGEVLAARLARVRRIAPHEAIRIGIDVCRGLAAAHAAGVLHRDLKPENVILARDERAVIADFGIAHAFAEHGARGGVLVGTPAYMAPEQVEGAPNLDARGDLYALGAMLFELLTGALPFAAETPLAMAAVRLFEAAPDPRSRVPEIAPALAEVIRLLLERRPEDRYSDASAAADALAAIGEVPHVPDARRSGLLPRPAAYARKIAILPIMNAGPAEDAYLARAITDDLADLLTEVPELRVRPRGDTSAYDARDRDARAIGRGLGVDVVVDGALRRVGSSLRVAIRLLTVADGVQLWARSVACAPADVVGIARQSATAIARALTTREIDTNGGSPIDPRAEELYLRGRDSLQRAWFTANDDAAALLREAHALAPSDPRIAGTLALALTRAVDMDGLPPELAHDIRSTADHALRLAPDQPEARVARGLVHILQGEVSAGVTELGMATMRAPNNVDALATLGRILVELGRITDGLEMLDRALAIEPGCDAFRVHRAHAHALAGDWDAVADDLRDPPMLPGDVPAYVLMKARLLMWRGAVEEAIAVVEAAGGTLDVYVRRAALAALRVALAPVLTEPDIAGLDAALPIQRKHSSRRVAYNAQTRAEVFLASGHLEHGARMLDLADENGLFDIAWLDHAPLLSPLRETHPTFARVRKSVALRAARALDALDTLR